MPTSSVEEMVAEIRAGRIVIIVDDEGRENEGDLVIAAEKTTPDAINFMARHGRGLICLTLTRERCSQLNLPLMVSDTDNRLATNFTLSIDASDDVTTGISAQDRARTVRAAVAPDARPSDVTRPGHIFPLMAQPGGVLTRAGHTEAGCDFAQLAGFEPAAVIVEILKDDGSMARRDDIEVFATEHGLKIGTIEDLIVYRIARSPTVRLVRREQAKTAYGEFTMHVYEDVVNHATHLALTLGAIRRDEPVLVRVHVESTLNDTISIAGSRSWPLPDVLRRIVAEGRGVAVVLRLPEKYAGLQEQIGEMLRDNAGVPRGLSGSASGARGSGPSRPMDRWTLGVGGQILHDLGVGRMRLMSSPQNFHGLGGFGLSVEECIGG